MWLLQSLKGQMELVLHVPWALTAGPDLHSANISLKGQRVNIILGFVGQEVKLRVLCTYIINKTKQTKQNKLKKNNYLKV